MNEKKEKIKKKKQSAKRQGKKLKVIAIWSEGNGVNLDTRSQGYW